LQIEENGSLVVKAHPRVPMSFINAFIEQKQSWIKKKQHQINTRNSNAIIINPHLIDQYKEQARELIGDKLLGFSTIMNLKYSKFRISSAKTRFGSCTSKGLLSFSWRLIFFPQEIIDYVVVHELTHLIEFNHSKRFWARIGFVLPEYKRCRKWLRTNGHIIIA